MSDFLLPAAILDDSPQSRARLAEAERHLERLRRQAAILSLARILSSNPRLLRFQLVRMVPANPRDAASLIFFVTNRGATPQLDAALALRGYSPAHPQGSFGHIRSDRDAGSKEDSRLLSQLQAWIRAQPGAFIEELTSASRLIRSPHPEANEDLPSALMRQAFSPTEFAEWQAAVLAAQAPSPKPPRAPSKRSL